MSMRILHTDRMQYKQVVELRAQFEKALFEENSLETAREHYLRFKEAEQKLPFPFSRAPIDSVTPATE